MTDYSLASFLVLGFSVNCSLVQVLQVAPQYGDAKEELLALVDDNTLMKELFEVSVISIVAKNVRETVEASIKGFMDKVEDATLMRVEEEKTSILKQVMALHTDLPRGPVTAAEA